MKRLYPVLFFLVGGLALGCASPEPAPEAATPAAQPESSFALASLPEVRYYVVADG